MLLVCGTLPDETFPLTLAPLSWSKGMLSLNGAAVDCGQGTSALASAACVASSLLGGGAPLGLFAGDRGSGKGSRAFYEHLIRNLPDLAPDVVVLHYCLPVMGLMRRFCEAVDRCRKRPVLIADASSMYAAKAAGAAERFDVFTPDASEMAFLADPEATHPAYISRHLFDTDPDRTPELVEQAYRDGNAARIMVVKGGVDYIVEGGVILETVQTPDLPALEAIGGTGDTIAGLLAALVDCGYTPAAAAGIAARANRAAGQVAGATPATRIRELIEAFPSVFDKHLAEWAKSYIEGGKYS